MLDSFIFNSTTAVTWILFLAMPAIAFVWWRKAFQILIKKDFSNVLLKKGESPKKNLKVWGYLIATSNFLAGGVIFFVLFKVLLFAVFYYKDLNAVHFNFDVWSEATAITIWVKFIVEFIFKQQAHPLKLGRRKKEEIATT